MEPLTTRFECAHITCGQARFAHENPWCAEHALIALAKDWPKFYEWYAALSWTRDNVVITGEDLERRALERILRGLPPNGEE